MRLLMRLRLRHERHLRGLLHVRRRNLCRLVLLRRRRRHGFLARKRNVPRQHRRKGVVEAAGRLLLLLLRHHRVHGGGGVYFRGHETRTRALTYYYCAAPFWSVNG
jgi:hypothetical protein